MIGCDRPWLTADATIPGQLLRLLRRPLGRQRRRRCVPNLECKTSTATNQFFSCGRQYVTSSRDGGKTWKPFVPVDYATAPADYTNGFSGIPVARAGVLATAYLAGKAPGSSCTTCLVFQTSRDDGTTWTTHVVPGRDRRPVARRARPQPAGDQLLAGLRALPRPGPVASRAATRSCTSTRRRPQLLVQVTTDFGRTWTRPVRLAETGGVQRWLPWIAYGTGGALGVMWRTTYADGSYAIWAAVSPHGTHRLRARRFG